MTDAILPRTEAGADSTAKRLARRHAAERRFQIYGRLAILTAVLMLGTLLGSIVLQGTPAFFQSEMRLEVDFAPDVIDPKGALDPADLRRADYQLLITKALYAQFPDVTGRKDKRALKQLASSDAGFTLRKMVLADPSLVGTTQSVWVKTNDDADQYIKHGDRNAKVEEGGRLSPAQVDWLKALEAKGDIEERFNTTFFTAGDSREPEQAGILGALVGSALTLIVTLAISFPLAVMAAVYLEEFAPKNKWTDMIEVNINNLAAVPSIVFGLLGLAVFLNVFGMPRSAPVVGGLVLALMTLPTIIIAARAALKSVPPSIRQAALGMGASPLQVVLHHVLPLAMPGILTGTIIGMAQALGETAPLIMIGMVAFIADVPGGFTDPATVLPVQIFIWADAPERAFLAKTSAAIMVLVAFLIVMNALAVVLRKRFERRW
ncbi:MAG: phosphate ABC transporter permease PstA [Pseudomonadota bacterium]